MSNDDHHSSHSHRAHVHASLSRISTVIDMKKSQKRREKLLMGGEQ